MFLKELYELYGRLVSAGVDIPVQGKSLQKISFRVTLKKDGELVGIDDIREPVIHIKRTKKGETSTTTMVAAPRMVLGGNKPPGQGINPCFLWDNAVYLLGYVDEKSANDVAKIEKRFKGTQERYLAFEQRINNPAFSAVCRFLSEWTPSKTASYIEEKNLSAEMFVSNGIFEVLGYGDVHEIPSVQHWYFHGGAAEWSGSKGDSSPMAPCLITGDVGPIAQLHEPAIKGVKDASSMGAKLVSFDKKAYRSYGKEQALNAPVSEQASFAYCNALNHLLASDTQRLIIGDTTIVFWTDSPLDEAQEDAMTAQSSLDFNRFEQQAEAQDQAMVDRVRASMTKLAAGVPPKDILRRPDTRFFMLGLAPNVARLSVRFYYESTLGEFLENVQKHYLDCKLQARSAKFKDPEFITPYMILRETARESKDIPPLYAGALMRSILYGTPYPDSIAGAIVRRIKADGYVNYIRCAYQKAWLTRRNPQLQITPMINEQCTQTGYLLGRLFATLVKIQNDALGDLNRNIHDAYYNSASSSPQRVFPMLTKLNKHHLSKLGAGLRIHRQQQLQDIAAKLDPEQNPYPARLNLEQQNL